MAIATSGMRRSTSARGTRDASACRRSDPPPKMTRITPADPPAARRAGVARFGPVPREGGGMPAVVAGLVAPPLAALHDLQVTPSHRTGSVQQRLLVFARALRSLAGFCLRPGVRVVHLHTTVGGSMY